MMSSKMMREKELGKKDDVDIIISAVMLGFRSIYYMIITVYIVLAITCLCTLIDRVICERLCSPISSSSSGENTGVVEEIPLNV